MYNSILGQPHLCASIVHVLMDLELKAGQMRRSLFGYFCRRCFVSFIKLSFPGVVKLQKNYRAWIGGDSSSGYDVINKEQLTNG